MNASAEKNCDKDAKDCPSQKAASVAAGTDLKFVQGEIRHAWKGHSQDFQNREGRPAVP
jgi:hypothetical protein